MPALSIDDCPSAGPDAVAAVRAAAAAQADPAQAAQLTAAADFLERYNGDAMFAGVRKVLTDSRTCSWPPPATRVGRRPAAAPGPTAARRPRTARPARAARRCSLPRPSSAGNAAPSESSLPAHRAASARPVRGSKWLGHFLPLRARRCWRAQTARPCSRETGKSDAGHPHESEAAMDQANVCRVCHRAPAACVCVSHVVLETITDEEARNANLTREQRAELFLRRRVQEALNCYYSRDPGALERLVRGWFE